MIKEQFVHYQRNCVTRLQQWMMSLIKHAMTSLSIYPPTTVLRPEPVACGLQYINHDYPSTLTLYLLVVCWLEVITFANRLDTDQARQNFGSDLDPV